jgi:prepilin-type N-terminal cleavage/methylation domain-containing protein
MHTQKGFTLLELIITIVLMVLISRLVFTSFSALNNRQILDKEVAQIKSYIQKARIDSLNSKDGDVHGIVFATSTVSVISELATSTLYEYVLNNRVSLATSTLGNSKLTFARISGLPSATGTLTYVFKMGNAVIGTSSITINGIGIVQ